MQQKIARFLRHLHIERAASEHTLKSYREDLQTLVAYFSEEDGSCLDPSTLTAVELRGYLSALHEAGYAKTSIARKLASLRSFFRFGQREGWIDNNPAKALRNPRKAHKLPHFLTTGEIGKLLVAPASDMPMGLARSSHSRNALLCRPARERISWLKRWRHRFRAIHCPSPRQRPQRTARPVGIVRHPSPTAMVESSQAIAQRIFRPRGAGFRQQIWHTAYLTQRWPNARKTSPHHRPRPANQPTHLTTQLCHTFTRPRSRHPQCARTTRPQKPSHHTNLYARQHKQSARCIRKGAPASSLSYRSTTASFASSRVRWPKIDGHRESLAPVTHHSGSGPFQPSGRLE